MAKLDFKQRQELTGFLEVALDEDALSEKVSAVLAERDDLRGRIETMVVGLEEIRRLARWNGPAAAPHAMYAIWEAARKLLRNHESNA